MNTLAPVCAQCHQRYWATRTPTITCTVCCVRFCSDACKDAHDRQCHGGRNMNDGDTLNLTASGKK